MPRLWGLQGIIHGRIVEARRFEFVFPSEELMLMTLRGGPWAYADRMLILERWTPLFNPLEMHYIRFWVHIRGILTQFMNRTIIAHIGRALGQLLSVEYDAAAAIRVEYVRVLLLWNVNDPLRFQRNFQFTPGHNTLLSFKYERLRGFCDVCGLLTHDAGWCLRQNGDPEEGPDDGDDQDDNDHPPQRRNLGVVIREIAPEEQNGFQDHDVFHVEDFVPVATPDHMIDDMADVEVQNPEDPEAEEAIDVPPGFGSNHQAVVIVPPEGNLQIGNVPQFAGTSNPADFSPQMRVRDGTKRKREDAAESMDGQNAVQEIGESSVSVSYTNKADGGTVGPVPPSFQ